MQNTSDPSFDVNVESIINNAYDYNIILSADSINTCSKNMSNANLGWEATIVNKTTININIGTDIDICSGDIYFVKK